MSDLMYDEVPGYKKGGWKSYCVHNEKEIKGFFGEYRWLSNFWPCEIYFNGNRFSCVESAYQSQKSGGLYVDKFINVDAYEAKKMGRKMALTGNWSEIKYDVMACIVFDKFYRNIDLRQELLDTGDRYLEETNNWGDIYWGVAGGIGKNNLGKILMKVRSFWK